MNTSWSFGGYDIGLQAQLAHRVAAHTLACSPPMHVPPEEVTYPSTQVIRRDVVVSGRSELQIFGSAAQKTVTSGESFTTSTLEPT